MPTPELSESSFVDVDSMLSRKFGREIVNYFSGGNVNRVSFLRTNYSFLSAALKHPSANFLIFRDLAPLGQDLTRLEFLSYQEVKPLIGEDPFSKSEEQLISDYDSRVTIPQLVFLGLDESQKRGFEWHVYQGSPTFAVDSTPRGSVLSAAESFNKNLEARGLEFVQGRMNTSLPFSDAATYAQARALLDWNARNPFCGQCGQPTLSINAGTKRTCPPGDVAISNGARLDCPTRKGISNLSFPRTDPTVIMAVLSADGKRVLVGRQKRWPPNWYSTLAGFVEAGESVEEAVRREVWEESGVTIGRVVLHSTQPWPYPANLMIGAVAECLPGKEDVVLDHDPELEVSPFSSSAPCFEHQGFSAVSMGFARPNPDAKWIAMEELREALTTGVSNLGEDPPPEYRPGTIRLPPRTAIAHQLLKSVADDGFLGTRIAAANSRM